MTTNLAGPAYLRRMFAGTTGRLSLFWKPTENAEWRWFNADADAVLHKAGTMNGDLYAVYARMTTVSADAAKRGGNADSVEAVALFADVDYGTEGHKVLSKDDRHLPADEAEARSIVALAGLPEPTLWVHSGGGLYPIWQFADPWPLTDPDERAAYDALHTRWNEQLEAGAAVAGLWYAPSNRETARVLRLPGTVNHKAARDRPCHVLSDDGPTYTVDQLQQAVSDAEFTHGVAVPRGVSGSGRRYTDEQREQFDFAEVFSDKPLDRLKRAIGFDGLLKSKGWTDCPCPRTDCDGHWTRPGDASEPHSAHRPLVRDENGHVRTVDALVVFSSSVEAPTLEGLSFGAVLASLYDIEVGTTGTDADWAEVNRQILAWEEDPGNPFADLGWGDDSRRSGWERVFSATPTLRHIQQSAHFGQGPAPILLAQVLARVAAEVPIGFRLPGKQDGSIGTRAELNYGVLISAPSGGGKSMSVGESRVLLPGVDQSEYVEQAGIATGEGLERSFLIPVTVDDEGRKVKQLQLSGDPRRLFFVDEIKGLAAKSKSAESTVVASLCTMIMGGFAGTTLATEGTTRRLPAGSYRFVLVVGAQPVNTGLLLHDVDTGTPQRFLWVAADDPTLTVESALQPDPGPLDWSCPIPPLYGGEQVMKVEPRIVGLIRHARLMRALSPENRPDGVGEPDPRESHLLLLQLKTAALLALLHNEATVTDQWWALAAEIVRMSLLEQRRCIDLLAVQGRREAVRRATDEGHAAVIRDSVVRSETSRRERMRERVRKYLVDGPVKTGELRKKVAASERDLFDETIAAMMAEGLVETDGKTYTRVEDE